MTSNVRQEVWRIVTNRPLSTWLLMAVTALLVVGALLPNPAFLTPAEVADLQARSPLLFMIGAKFNSQRLATGYFFGFIGVYLIISATLCSIDRLLARRERPDSRAEPGQVGGQGGEAVVVATADVEETRRFITNWLRRRLFGARIWQNPLDGTIRAERGRIGFWGSILFHVVLITALTGMAVFFLAGTRGRLVFTEGQRYRLDKSRITRLEKEPFWGISLPPVEMELLKQYSLFAPDDPQTAIEHVARFRIVDAGKGSDVVQDIKINAPLRLGGKDFLLMNGGFSPRVVISDSGGGAGFDSFVNLRSEAGTKDDFITADGQLHIDVRFFPDFARELGRPMTKSLQMRNPAVAVVVTRQGRKLFEDIVPIGGNAQFAGYVLTVPDVRRWVEVEMVNEPGIGFFFMVAFVGIVGLVFRMLDPDEQLTIVTRAADNGTLVEFTAESRHFAALLADIAAECAQACRSLGNGSIRRETEI